jgi:ribosomal protein S19E (S16A)
MGIVERSPNGGRRVTRTGRRDLDRISSQVKSQQLQQRRAAAVE